MTIRKRKKQFGFLLMEAVLAIMILSAGTVAIMRTYATSLAAEVISQQYLEASNLIEQLIADVLSQQEIVAGESSDTFEAPYDDYSWEVKVDEIMPEFDAPAELIDETQPATTETTEEQEDQTAYLLKVVTASVLWTYRGDEKKLTYQTAVIRMMPEDEFDETD